VEGIEGHEEVARALGYKKDDMGVGAESSGAGADAGGMEMGLKAYLKSVKKSEEEPETETGDEPEEPAEEEAMDHKGSAKLLGHLHNHMKNAHDYLTKGLKTLDHPQISKAMTHHLKDLSGHMESYKELHGQHHPDNDFEKMCKSLGGEEEEVAEETGADAEGEATTETDTPEEDTGAEGESGTELIRDNYSTPKSAKRQTNKTAADQLVLLERIKGSMDRISDLWFTKTGERL
jgi:hypothetical protein